MPISPRPLLAVAIAAALAALPLALAMDGMRLSSVSVGLTAGSSLAAAAWLAVLVASGAVQRLGILVGALIGFLSFATVLLVFLSLPAEPGATGTVADRVALAGIVLYRVGLYPLVAGGVLGLLLRRMPLRNAA